MRGVLLLQAFPGLGAVLGDDDIVAPFFEDGYQEMTSSRIVFGDQDLHG